MSATIMSDPTMMMSSTSAAVPESQPSAAAAAALASQSAEAELVKCECCGLTEECTPEYIERVRERYQGTWICGLCAEAVKDEICRSHQRLISTEEAMNLHMNFCKKFKSSTPPANPTVHLITAMRQILRRSLDNSNSPRVLRSTPSSPMRKDREIAGPKLTRSGSCFPTLSG